MAELKKDSNSERDPLAEMRETIRAAVRETADRVEAELGPVGNLPPPSIMPSSLFEDIASSLNGKLLVPGEIATDVGVTVVIIDSPGDGSNETSLILFDSRTQEPLNAIISDRDVMRLSALSEDGHRVTTNTGTGGIEFVGLNPEARYTLQFNSKDLIPQGGKFPAWPDFDLDAVPRLVDPWPVEAQAINEALDQYSVLVPTSGWPQHELLAGNVILAIAVCPDLDGLPCLTVRARRVSDPPMQWLKLQGFSLLRADESEVPQNFGLEIAAVYPGLIRGEPYRIVRQESTGSN